MASNLQQAFFNGQEYWKNNDYLNARSCFEISYHDNNFKIESLAKLIQIEIREGKYAKARELLNNNQNLNNPILKQLYGLLENIENNFNQSKKYYNECMQNPNMQYKSLLALVKLYVQTGDYDIAEKMYQTLQLNPRFYIQSTIGLTCLNILKKRFYDAQQCLKKIDESKLTPKIAQHYNILNAYVKYFLGQLKPSDNIYDPIKDYMIYRLFDNSEQTLLYHIKKHKNQSEKVTNGCFFKYTDLKKLLLDAKEKIKNMNGNHFEISDMYRFKLDTPIGYKGDLITNDLCVVTMIGTKDIITMYPVSLSSEFDNEGLSTSEQLKKKRLQGGIKND